MKTGISGIVCLFIICFNMGCSSSTDPDNSSNSQRLIQKNIPAPSLSNNMFEDITSQPVAIYLPPSYFTSSKRYPVVYFLSGFITKHTAFLDGQFQGFKLKDSMDGLISEGKIKEIIVVMPNDDTFMAGSFYVNSSVRGNWEYYITQDLVNYIDNNYRTLRNVNSRGIAGHSMGGFGALNLAMLHPDIYCAAYGSSSGLFDENGLQNQGMFSLNNINKYLSKQEDFNALDEEAAKNAFKTYISNLLAQNETDEVFTYAYGAAFSPNPNNNPPYIDYPYYKSGNDVLLDSTLLQNYENGFGGLDDKVIAYKENLLSLKAIKFDYGNSDIYWIRNGSVYFSSLLQNAGIPRELLTFNGGHSDKVKERIENFILPFFSNTLDFE